MDLRCFRNIVFFLDLDCFLSLTMQRLEIIHRFATIIRFVLVASRFISLLLVQRHFATSSGVSVRSIRIAFGRQAVYERRETIAFQSTNSRRRTFNANEISARQKGAFCHYVYLLKLQYSVRRNMALTTQRNRDLMIKMLLTVTFVFFLSISIFQLLYV